jgi:hypothetical protein
VSSTNTPNLGLNKATPGTNEPFNPATVNSNWDKVDSAIGTRTSKFVTTTVGNTTTETVLYSLPINAGVQGSVYTLVAWGTVDHASGAILTLRGKIGGPGTAFAAIGINYPASVLTNQAWRVQLEITVATLGVSGTWRPSMTAMARVNGVNVPFIEVPSTGFVKDTTTTQALDITAQWTAASASSIIRCDSGYAYRITTT